MQNIKELLTTAIFASVAAGKEILDVYHTDFEVEQKADNSPLTLADRRAHQTIVNHIKPFGIPILSEEGRDIPYDERKSWQQLWIVDPLDGTKEFVKKNDEFTVNIALIKDGRPYMGVVFVPVKDQLYLGCYGMGTFKINGASGFVTGASPKLDVLLKHAEKLPLDSTSRTVFTVMGSRSHPSPALDEFIETLKKEHGEIDFISAGSSLKICLVAEGAADIYPRLGPTMEWDTAAGQAVAEYAGASVTEYESGKPLAYNRKDLLNPWFIVKR